MENKDEYKRTCRSLRQVCRMASTFPAVPERYLLVERDDVSDAEYVTEWLHIILCRICGQPDVSMKPFDESVSITRQFRWCIRKAARQAWAIQRGLLFGRIEKSQFAEKAWEGLDSAEIFLQAFLSGNVRLKRGRYK